MVPHLQNPYPNPEERRSLASSLGVSEYQVKTFFSSRRKNEGMPNPQQLQKQARLDKQRSTTPSLLAATLLTSTVASAESSAPSTPEPVLDTFFNKDTCEEDVTLEVPNQNCDVQQFGTGNLFLDLTSYRSLSSSSKVPFEPNFTHTKRMHAAVLLIIPSQLSVRKKEPKCFHTDFLTTVFVPYQDTIAMEHGSSFSFTEGLTYFIQLNTKYVVRA